MSPIEEIRACQYLYLHEISEPSDNELRLVVREARSGYPVPQGRLDEERYENLRDILSDATAIEHGPGCKVFDIRWSSYIAYSVLNESYASREPDTSQGFGRLFVEYTKSVFLDYLGRATFADSSYPGPFKHWGLYCLNHCVEVASTEEPTIEVSIYA